MFLNLKGLGENYTPLTALHQKAMRDYSSMSDLPTELVDSSTQLEPIRKNNLNQSNLNLRNQTQRNTSHTIEDIRSRNQQALGVGGTTSQNQSNCELKSFRDYDFNDNLKNNSGFKTLELKNNAQRSRSVLRGGVTGNFQTTNSIMNENSSFEIQDCRATAHLDTFQTQNPYITTSKPQMRSISEMRQMPSKQQMSKINLMSNKKDITGDRSYRSTSIEQTYNNWGSEKKQIFPIKKLEILQNFNVIDQQSLSKQIDDVIEKKQYTFYNYNKATFKYLENTVNFRQKLDQIDQVIDNQLFKGTLESIEPHYVYVKDEIQTSQKKRKLFNINDVEQQEKLKHIDYMKDHKGNIITKSGSKFEDLAQMIKRQKERETMRTDRIAKEQQLLQQQQKSSLIKKQSTIKSHYKQNSSGVYEHVLMGESESSSIRRRRQFNKRKTKDASLMGGLSSSIHYSKKPTSHFDKSHKDKQSQIDLVGQMSEWFKEKFEREQKKEEFMKIYDDFKEDLENQLEFQSNDDLSDNSQVGDEIIQKKMLNSNYNEEFNSNIEKQKNQRTNKKILKMLLGEDITLTKARKQNSSIDQGLNNVQNKLKFMNEMNRAQDQMLKFYEKKKFRKMRIRGINNQTLEKVVFKMQDDLNKINQQLEKKLFEDEEGEWKHSSISEAYSEFLKECLKENIVPPLIYKQIDENRLQFINQNLQRGICRALARSIKNNNLDDENFSIILEAVVEATRLKGLYTLQNTFGQKSLEFIIQLVQKPYPNNLRELVLTGSKISSGIISSLLENLKSNNQLEIIGLSSQKFDQHASVAMIHLVKNSTSLRALDMSYCQFFKANALIEFLKSTSSKHSIEFLNISFNTVEQSKTSELVTALKQFIHQSATIMHLNLSACGIKGTNAINLFQSMKKSKSLQSVHFSGNELEGDIVNKIRALLQSKNERHLKESGALYASQVPDQTENSTKKEEGKLPEINYQNSATQKQQPQPSLTEKERNFNKKYKPNIDIYKEEENIHINDQYVFSRVLGHYEITGGHKWVEREECWICQKWQYTLLIWSEMVGDQFYDCQPIKFINQFEDQIRKANPTLTNIVEISTNEAVIFGNYTNYQYMKMIPMLEFVERIEKNLKPYLRIVAKEEEKERINELIQQRYLKMMAKLSVLKILGGPSKKTSDDQEKFKIMQKEEWKSVFRINKEWPKILDQSSERFELQQAISVQEIMQLKPKPDERYYAYANYFPHGQAQFMVLSKIRSKHCYCKTITVNQRHRDIKLAFKKIKKLRVNRNFNLKTSVFNQWAVSLEEEYRKCFESDMKFSKIKKFIKDPDQYSEICNILLGNYGKILEVYLYCSGRSNYPSIQWIDFTDQCSVWKIIDKNLTLATIDRLFIAVNFEGVPGGLDDNPDKELCRYEFFELLVRMALAKFPNVPQCEALRTLLNEYILSDPNVLSWYKFRQELIWTLEVDDLLKTNKNNIQKLYQASLTVTKRQFNLEDAVNLVNQCPNLKLNDKEATQAFAYSKFPVTDEMQDINQVLQLNLQEFSEFIARLAQIKYPDPQMTLYDKIFRVMTELFKLIGVQPQHPQNDEVGESESDYDDFIENQ